MLMTNREEAEKIVDFFLKENKVEGLIGSDYYMACVEVVEWLIEEKALKKTVKKGLSTYF